MQIVEQNAKITLYCLFLDQNGEQATISGTPTVSIYHMRNNTVKNDINEDSMVQVNGSLYAYEHFVAPNADKSFYTARFSATYSDTTEVKGMEIFQVVKMTFFERASSGGPVVNKTVVKDIWTDSEKKAILDRLDEIKNQTVPKVEVWKPEDMTELATFVSELSNRIGVLKNDVNEKIAENKFDLENYNKSLLSLSDSVESKFGTLLSKLNSNTMEIKLSLESLKSTKNMENKTINGALTNIVSDFNRLDGIVNKLTELVAKNSNTESLREMVGGEDE